MRDIKAGEEVTLDYSTLDYEAGPMRCFCGHASCRQWITGFTDLTPADQARLRPYVSFPSYLI